MLVFWSLLGPERNLHWFFLPRLISAVNRIISDAEVRKILIESLAFENANSESKRATRRLEARSAPTEEWIRNMADIGPHIYNSNLVG
jgi:hypothetical protein